MTTFEEFENEFPELSDILHFDGEDVGKPELDNGIQLSEIRKHCLSKQRVKEALGLE